MSSIIDSAKVLAEKWRKDPYKKEEINLIFKDYPNTWMNTNITTVNVCFKTMRLKDKVQCFIMSLELRDNEWVLIDAHFDGLSVSNMYGQKFITHLNNMHQQYANELIEEELR